VPVPRRRGEPSVFQHVVYILKENKTYDQILGDLPQGNGDPSLCIYPEDVSPNHHALARQYVLLDNFYVESEVSADGHEWSMAAYATDFVEKTWPYHDYTTISPSILSDRLAQIALAPGNRERLLQRTKGILQANFPILGEWLERQAGFFDFLPPAAGAIAFAGYRHDLNSTELVNRLIREKSVLVVPGDQFEMDHHLRFGFGSEADYIRGGLARVEELLREIRRR